MCSQVFDFFYSESGKFNQNEHLIPNYIEHMIPSVTERLNLEH